MSKAPKPKVEALVDTHQAETAADKVAAELRLTALRDSLARNKQEYASLSATNFQLAAETASSKADLRDINEFLTNQLKATALTNATLASRIDDLEQRLLETAAAHADELARIKRETAAERAENMATMAVMLDKSTRAEAFLDAEEGLQAHVQAVEQHAADTKAECEERIREVERQCVAFKERMRKEQVAAIKNAEVEARRKVEGQNLTLDQLNATLHAQAAQVTQLLDQLGKVQVKCKDSTRDLDLIRASEAALLAKGALYRQAIHVLTAKVREGKQREAWRNSLHPGKGTASVLGASLRSQDDASSLERELAAAQQELATLRQAGSKRLLLTDSSLPSLAQCVSGIVQDRVAGVLTSPPSSERYSAGGLTLYERQQLQEWLDAAVRAEAHAEALALTDLVNLEPPGPEGLRLNLAALQPEPAGQHIAAAAAGDSGPSFRSFSGSRIFADLLEGPSPGIAA